MYHTTGTLNQKFIPQRRGTQRGADVPASLLPYPAKAGGGQRIAAVLITLAHARRSSRRPEMVFDVIGETDIADAPHIPGRGTPLRLCCVSMSKPTRQSRIGGFDKATKLRKKTPRD